MQTKIKQYQHLTSAYIRRFNDIRFTGQVVFAVIVLLISWSGVKAIQTNYGLQKRVAALQQQNAVQKLQNNNLALQNKYYQSNQYLELSARQNLGLAAPGEQELLVPKDVALAYTIPVSSAPAAKASAQQPASQRNFEAWVGFFLHRQSTD